MTPEIKKKENGKWNENENEMDTVHQTRQTPDRENEQVNYRWAHGYGNKRLAICI